MQTKNILISVIIPYYKNKNYIYNTLKSALNQSHKKIEIVIIYDDENLKDLKYFSKLTILQMLENFLIYDLINVSKATFLILTD